MRVLEVIGVKDVFDIELDTEVFREIVASRSIPADEAWEDGLVVEVSKTFVLIGCSKTEAKILGDLKLVPHR